MFRHWRWVFCIAFLSLFSERDLHGQFSAFGGGDTTIRDEQLWVDYNPSLYFKPNMRVSAQLGFRYFPDAWRRVHGRLNFRWTPGKWYERMNRNRVLEFQVGLSYFYSHHFRSPSVSEIRPYQGFLASFPTLRRFRLMHYVRVEERFETNVEEDYFEFSGRLRYRLSVQQNLGSGPVLIHFYIPASLEFFFNLNHGVIYNDVFRGGLGLGSYLGDEWRAEFLVSYHNVNSSFGDVWKSHDLVFRIRVFTNFEYRPTYSRWDIPPVPVE